MTLRTRPPSATAEQLLEVHRPDVDYSPGAGLVFLRAAARGLTADMSKVACLRPWTRGSHRRGASGASAQGCGRCGGARARGGSEKGARRMLRPRVQNGRGGREGCSRRGWLGAGTRASHRFEGVGWGRGARRAPCAALPPAAFKQISAIAFVPRARAARKRQCWEEPGAA